MTAAFRPDGSLKRFVVVCVILCGLCLVFKVALDNVGFVFLVFGFVFVFVVCVFNFGL